MTRRAAHWTLALLGLGSALLACLATLTQSVLGHGLTGQYYANASWTGAPSFTEIEARYVDRLTYDEHERSGVSHV